MYEHNGFHGHMDYLNIGQLQLIKKVYSETHYKCIIEVILRKIIQLQ